MIFENTKRPWPLWLLIQRELKLTHADFVDSMDLEMSEEEKNLPYLYWTPKIKKTPFVHYFIAGSSKCTTEDLSCLPKTLLFTIKDGLIRYCATKTSRNILLLIEWEVSAGIY